ncbi:DNA phosphorothioation-dependent restriction protein DptG [Bhargavaea massiliensis]|uniref:DNA phosphorothioation-dependent restriction protein DptG n=1 Tax=Bhargavaea massiliensis TaxID=2697500 RepID=UPI001BCF20DB|nr:DNA phosphorothioation-dependent restriction protein DptG [Bhargavaea massiliensis]
MSQILDISTLERLYQKNHSRGKIAEVLPFTTHNKYSNAHWTQMIGELVQLITDIKINYDKIPAAEFETNYNDLSLFIAQQIDYEDEDALEDLATFIDRYLFNGTEIKTVHPFLFNFIASQKSKNEEAKYASFVLDVFYDENSGLKDFFTNKKTTDVLNETILKALDDQIVGNRKKKNREFDRLLGNMADLYNEDLKYLMKKTKYFNEVFPLFTHYYLFSYCCQVIYRFGEYENAKYKEIIPFYYSLEWESLRGSRQAATGANSYKIIQDRAKSLFPNMHAQFQLSHIALNEQLTEDLRYFVAFPELHKVLEEKGLKDQFLLEANTWIERYCEIWGLEVPQTPQSLEGNHGVYRVLASCISQGMNQTAIQKYSKNIESLGKGTFLKSRGSLGYVFNLSHEMVMLLITVCVKDERIPLKSLYEKLEARGIALDYSSKRELVKMLESHNLLDKKSDSGDAQYVKPIL